MFSIFSSITHTTSVSNEHFQILIKQIKTDKNPKKRHTVFLYLGNESYMRDLPDSALDTIRDRFLLLNEQRLYYTKSLRLCALIEPLHFLIRTEKQLSSGMASASKAVWHTSKRVPPSELIHCSRHSLRPQHTVNEMLHVSLQGSMSKCPYQECLICCSCLVVQLEPEKHIDRKSVV